MRYSLEVSRSRSSTPEPLLLRSLFDCVTMARGATLQQECRYTGVYILEADPAAACGWRVHVQADSSRRA